MEYEIWEGEIIDGVVVILNVARGDAQAVVEAQPFAMAQGWGADMAPADVAANIAGGA